MKKTSNRPVCGCCGKRYGSRVTHTETVRWNKGEQPPAYRGNGVVVKDVGSGFATASRSIMEAEARRVFDPVRRAQALADAAKLPPDTSLHGYREIWDGQSWHGGYDPFCTLRCALAYARKAYARSKR